MKSVKSARLCLGFGAVLLFATASHADDPTIGTAAQWKELCSDSSVSCQQMHTSQGMETYHVCAKNLCYVVLCNEHSPDAVCLKDDLPGKRPPAKRIQAGVFGLL